MFGSFPPWPIFAQLREICGVVTPDKIYETEWDKNECIRRKSY